MSELQDELDETGIIKTIPEDRLDMLIEKADRDGDAFVTFTEFINLVCTSYIIMFIILLTCDRNWEW